MTKKKKTSTRKKRDPNCLAIVCEPHDKDKATAQKYLCPEVLAGASIKSQYKNDDDIDVNHLVIELTAQSKLVHEGDLKRAESMLISQAHTLDSLFAELLSRSRMNMGEYMNAAEKYMRLALKAQSQCRTTLEALAEIKNPKPYIQNNKAQYQQVNNGTLEPHAHGGNLKQANELLEDKTNEQESLDAGTPQATSRDDKELEAVGAKHWPEK
tara:strand:- start:3629 stop:4264 length:636 start_codon:yes stop_codon:yes gene_type:complete